MTTALFVATYCVGTLTGYIIFRRTAIGKVCNAIIDIMEEKKRSGQ